MKSKMDRRAFLSTGLSAAAFGPPGSYSKRRPAVEIKFVPNWGLEDFARQLASEFMESNPSIRIAFSDRVQFDQPDYDQELLRAYRAGDPYDMVITAPYYSMWATQNGYTIDPAPLFRRDFGANYADLFKDVLVWWKDRLVGVPFKSGTELFYCNHDLMESAEVAVPHEGWGWGDLVSKTSKIVEYSAEGETLQWGCSLFEPELFRLYVATAGEQLFSPDYRECLFDSPSSREAVRLLHDLIYRYRAMGNPRQWPRNTDEVATSWNHQAFYQGNVGLFLDGDLRVKRAYDQAEANGFRIGVAPPLKGKQKAVPAAPSVFQIWKSPDQDRIEAAWEFAKFWMTPRNQARLLAETGNSPLLLAAYEEPLARRFLEKCPGAAVFRDAYQYSNRAAGIGTYPTMALEYLGIRPSIYRLSRNVVTPMEAIEQMQQKCQTILDEFWTKAERGIFELFPESRHR